ncbi:hypothetical protein [Rhizobium sp. A37_96]
MFKTSDDLLFVGKGGQKEFEDAVAGKYGLTPGRMLILKQIFANSASDNLSTLDDAGFHAWWRNICANPDRYGMVAGSFVGLSNNAQVPIDDLGEVMTTVVRLEGPNGGTVYRLTKHGIAVFRLFTDAYKVKP